MTPSASIIAHDVQFTVASSIEISVTIYDKWAERLEGLIAVGDLLHVGGTGAIVAENAA